MRHSGDGIRGLTCHPHRPPEAQAAQACKPGSTSFMTGAVVVKVYPLSLTSFLRVKDIFLSATTTEDSLGKIVPYVLGIVRRYSPEAPASSKQKESEALAQLSLVCYS